MCFIFSIFSNSLRFLTVWEVSLLCVYSCKTFNNVIPDICPANVSTSLWVGVMMAELKDYW